jgi:hypothetical protein
MKTISKMQFVEHLSNKIENISIYTNLFNFNKLKSIQSLFIQAGSIIS